MFSKSAEYIKENVDYYYQNIEAKYQKIEGRFKIFTVDFIHNNKISRIWDFEELKNLGPDKFSQQIRNKKYTLITDTTMRDAHQSLLATRMRTDDLVNIAEFYRDTEPEYSKFIFLLGKLLMTEILCKREQNNGLFEFNRIIQKRIIRCN